MVANVSIDMTPNGASLERIARDLVRVRQIDNGGLISTPVLYPSGAHVTVRVSFYGDRCLVTDDGSGCSEAELMGATLMFRRAARRVAEAAGVHFNDFEIFEAEATAETVTGLVAIIADVSRQAVELAAERMARQNVRDAKTIVFERLEAAFGAEHVTRDVIFSGASAHEWALDALVTTDDVRVAVAIASPAAVSVSSAYVKLDDIRRLDSPPKTAVALTQRDTFKGDQIALLNRTAKLIDIRAPEREFRLLAA